MSGDEKYTKECALIRKEYVERILRCARDRDCYVFEVVNDIFEEHFD